MSSFRAFRKAVAALLVATAATLACAAPSHALRLHPDRASTRSTHSARAKAERSVLSLLLHLFDCAGGAMDPNGHQ
jgi:hypothetical protein